MIWILFLLLILGLLFLDLGVFHKTDREIPAKESIMWTIVWISIALLFGVGIYFIYQHNLFGVNTHNTDPLEAMIKYYTGFLIEKSLSLDNIFVIAMIFSFFQIEVKYQHNILFWGILGAIVFRGVMIGLGTAFIETFHWSTYVLGAILVFSAITMMTARHDNVDYYKNPGLKLISRIYPIKWDVKTSQYFVTENGQRYATASLVVLTVIEFTDIIFAIDSIPAIFAITTDPFIVFSSNIFAILGLRSLYFFLANMMDKFRYMKFSLAFVLIFVGIKMALANHYKFPTFVSLSFILGFLLVGIITSILAGSKDTAQLKKPL